jgi:hypothetical protein
MENEQQRNEFHIKIATSHLIAGALFYEMELDEIIKLINETCDEYKKQWELEKTSMGVDLATGDDQTVYAIQDVQNEHPQG